MTETTKIVRTQQRRGQKQDLPKPLRPGEIGFATDSRQIYIGADTTDPVSDVYNKTGMFEKTASAQSTTTSFADVQLIKFTVPHKIYDKGEFDGVTDTVSWTPSTTAASSNTATQYSRLGTVFRPADTTNNILALAPGTPFYPADLSVIKNGVKLAPSAVGIIGSGNDYYFTQSGDSHTITLRTPPSGAEAISVSYYSNAAVINAITNTTIGNTGVPGFYASNTISPYRQLSTDNIRVSDGIGVGYIGLQFKHIQVATDVKHTPLPAEYTSLLGTIYLTKNDTAVASVTGTTTASTITLTGSIPTGTYANITNGVLTGSSVYSYVHVKGGNDWFKNGKVIAVYDYDSANAEIIATLPSNASSVARTISSVGENSSSKIILTVQNTQDIADGDSVLILENGGNVSQLANIEIAVSNVSTETNVVTLDLDYADYANANVELLSFITYKGGANTTVVVHSPRHGNLNGNSVVLADTATTLNGTYQVTTTGNEDTFIIIANIAVTANVDSLTVKPVVSSSTYITTPVVAIDLSSANTTAAVQTTVNGYNLWPKISSIPGETDKMYITHAESVAKTPFTFAVHNDTAGTVTALGLTPDEYSRADATVKAKLENWIFTTSTSATVNLFKEVYVNTEFNSTGTLFNEWDLNLNSSIGEMNFESRLEARDFTKILNNLYFESVNPDIRGLMNIKTNIEFLTAEALSAGTATTSYTAPENLVIATGTNPASELNLTLAAGSDGAYQTAIVEYSMKALTASGSYRRVGTLIYSGDTDIQDVVMTDTYSDARSGTLTGNVSFAASYDAGTASMTVSNTLNPSTSVSMKYIRRRWAD